MAKLNSLFFFLQNFLFLFLCFPYFSLASIHNKLQSQSPLNGISPSAYFEVTKPIKVPRIKPCSHLILKHDFGFTYGKPPVLANYTPPSHCRSQTFGKIVLEWKAACKGVQYDRIFGVWLGGVELLRGCTAEPTQSGIVWTVEKDITRYYSLLMKQESQTLVVNLGNVVDSTYTGVYHVNITLHFYPSEKFRNAENPRSFDHSRADLILPISRSLPLNDGLWYEIRNSSDTKVKEFRIPQNVYRAVVEVYVSYHENDEFWYTNPPNDCIESNNQSIPGNGPFREVLVTLDGELVSAVWPFTVIYTGGINPYFWKPISGIGSFNLPSYDIEITPFLGKVLDGKKHKLGFSVTNALNVWFIDANIHLWLDTRKTEGKLWSYNSIPLLIPSISRFKGLNGTFETSAKRFISATGWVKSSLGNITTSTFQEMRFNNSMEVEKDGNFVTVNQLIHSNQSVLTKGNGFHHVSVMGSSKRFPLSMFFDYSNRGDGNIVSVMNVSVGFDEDEYYNGAGFVLIGCLRNLQKSDSVLVVDNGVVVKRIVGTNQVYKYRGSDLCYFRNIYSLKNKIVYDKVVHSCDHGKGLVLGLASGEIEGLKTNKTVLII